MTNKSIPYIDQAGVLIIPFDSDKKYHYRNGGQPLTETLLELNAPEDILKNHIETPYPRKAA